MAETDVASRARAAAASRTKKKVKLTTQDTVKKAGIICAISLAVGVALLYLSPPKSFYETEVNNLALIDQVNQNAKVWTAAAQPAFDGWTVGDVRDLGTVSWRNPEAQWHLCPGTGETTYPENFDVRTKWPECFPDTVYHQGNCSSSWAIAAVSSVANRFCINDPVNYKMFALSPQNLVSCDVINDGCKGGGMDTVWTFLEQEGVVSETCMKYEGWDVECDAKCAEEEPLKLSGKCIAQGAEAVKKEVFNNGPVTVPLRVTDELLVYKGGIFTPTRTALSLSEPKRKQMKKVTVVKIMGWGVEDDQAYWLIENSWGKEWGEGGFARIAASDSEDPMDQPTLTVEFTFAGYPSNIQQMGGGAPMDDEFDDISLEDDGLDDLSFDDDDDASFDDVDSED